MPTIRYCGVVLDEESRKRAIDLAMLLSDAVMDDVIAHHMTIKLGELPDSLKMYKGMEFKIKVNGIGESEKALALRIDKNTGIAMKSQNEIPHVTIAVNRSKGGKPFDSNKIKNWRDISGFELNGTLEEVE